MHSKRSSLSPSTSLLTNQLRNFFFLFFFFLRRTDFRRTHEITNPSPHFGSHSASIPGTLFRHVTRLGAAIRCSHDMGSTRGTPNHNPLPQVYPAVRPDCHNWDVQKGIRGV